MSAAHAIGIDIGATNIKGVALTHDGKVLDAVIAQMDHRSNVVESVWRVLKLLGNVDRVGIAAPGIVRPGGRSIWWMQGRLAEVQGLDWTAALGRPVPVMNDANAALLGEVMNGAIACPNVVMLTLGTGVGGAAMVDGNPLRGHLGRAGHLGHISLDPDAAGDIVNTPGSLEEAIGECTIGPRSDGKYASTTDLVEHLDDDELARRVWQKSIRALACGLASLINVLDPELIIIGGGISEAGDKLFLPLRAQMEKVEWRPHERAARIVPAALGSLAGAIGAGWSAINNAEQNRE